MTPQETIMEQFKVIEDAVRDLKEMIEEPASKESLNPIHKEELDWFKTQHPTSISNNIPAGYDSEGNMTNY